MKVIHLNKDFEIKYQEFLLSIDFSLLYYSLNYRNLIQEVIGGEINYFIAIDESENIQGVLPLMVKDGPLGKVANSLPFYGSNGGVLGKTRAAEIELLKFYTSWIKSNNIAASTFISNPLKSEYENLLITHNFKDERIGQFTKIEGEFSDLEDIMTLFHYKTRNTIRKAIKAGIRIEVDNEAINFLYETHVENMISINGLYKPKSFFENISNHFKPNQDYKIYVAYLKEIPVAAMLIFSFNRTIEYFTPVIVKEYRAMQPLSYCIAKAMFDASKAGYTKWNWGGTWLSQGGVYDFKSKWGTINLPYHYYVQINNQAILNTEKEDLLKFYPFYYVIPFSNIKNN